MESLLCIPGVPLRILLALSVYSNAKKILDTNRAPGALDCVHGIRFLSMTWVILGHTLVFLISPVPLLSEYQQLKGDSGKSDVNLEVVNSLSVCSMADERILSC